MFHVLVPPVTPDCGHQLVAFRTERDARSFINALADGSTEYTLFDNYGQEIVRSAFPVLMVA